MLLCQQPYLERQTTLFCWQLNDIFLFRHTHDILLFKPLKANCSNQNFFTGICGACVQQFAHYILGSGFQGFKGFRVEGARVHNIFFKIIGYHNRKLETLAP